MEDILFSLEGKKENSEHLPKAPKKALKRVFRPRMPIPNHTGYD